MKLKNARLKNFRRLEEAEIDFEDRETVFVGPNNSGKTSATTAFRLFLRTPTFKIHDFSIATLAEFDRFGTEAEMDLADFPSIEMDLWFSIDPEVEFGRVFSLLTNLNEDLDEAGVRIRYEAKDAEKLLADFQVTHPVEEGEEQSVSLSHFLSRESTLSRYFNLAFYALERSDDGMKASPIEPDEGKRVLRNLIRVDFVDAQRNIDDYEESSRSNRLSSAFTAFYRHNLQQAEVLEEANQVIEDNNENLNKHYEEHFKELLEVIQELGVPSVNDRGLRIVSTLSPEVALKGNTDLLYVDPDTDHELPETYNGLGFKNLVYMAIQLSHFHLQWMNTEDSRPLCQVIFIEEPEAHLHAQVQQTFISNIWDIVRKASEKKQEEHMVPQLLITTHSSHILDTVEFQRVRYFQRCFASDDAAEPAGLKNSSRVLSLRDFRPLKVGADGVQEDEEVTLQFLKKYLRLTHCDLFFADGVVLVEGSVEKLLVPAMINKCASGLRSCFLTILEVGGAYAHRFASLIEFLDIPFLVITDLDSVDPDNGRRACRADLPTAVSSNASIKFFLNMDAVDDLRGLTTDQKVLSDGLGYLAYQFGSDVEGYEQLMYGRTIEETFAYENISLLRDGRLEFGVLHPDPLDFEREYDSIYQRVKSDGFKKTEFALNIASSEADWNVPSYVSEGLQWIQGKLLPVEQES